VKTGFRYHVLERRKVGFTLFLTGAILFASYAIGHSQSSKKMFHVAALVPGSSLTGADEAFREGLRRHCRSNQGLPTVVQFQNDSARSC